MKIGTDQKVTKRFETKLLEHINLFLKQTEICIET